MHFKIVKVFKQITLNNVFKYSYFNLFRNKFVIKFPVLTWTVNEVFQVELYSPCWSQVPWTFWHVKNQTVEEK